MPISRDAVERGPAGFCAERLSERITRIRDVARVAVYPVQGDGRALLVDTCCGMGDLRSPADAVCPSLADGAAPSSSADAVPTACG